MQCINFDRQFEAFAADWMRENAAKHRNNLDRMEALMPEIYEGWLHTAAEWLGGDTPGTYFGRFDDADVLTEWMLNYFREKVPVPDQLLERITELGEAAERALMAIVSNHFQIEEARLTAVSLLTEMGSVSPMSLYIGWITGRKERDDLCDMAAEALASMGQAVVSPILEAFEGATHAGQEAFADVLCNFPGDEAIFARTLSLFASRPEKRALFASLLSKLGDARALPALREAVTQESISYLDYLELRNAIESLGGDCPEAPEFYGDPYYESLRGMD